MVGRGLFVPPPPPQTNVWKISRLCGAITSLLLDVSEKGYGQCTLLADRGKSFEVIMDI